MINRGFARMGRDALEHLGTAPAASTE